MLWRRDARIGEHGNPASVASDIIARAVFEQVGKQVGQTFVIEKSKLLSGSEPTGAT
jgi:hypothetical protein